MFKAIWKWLNSTGKRTVKRTIVIEVPLEKIKTQEKK